MWRTPSFIRLLWFSEPEGQNGDAHDKRLCPSINGKLCWIGSCRTCITKGIENLVYTNWFKVDCETRPSNQTVITLDTLVMKSRIGMSLGILYTCCKHIALPKTPAVTVHVQSQLIIAFARCPTGYTSITAWYFTSVCLRAGVLVRSNMIFEHFYWRLNDWEQFNVFFPMRSYRYRLTFRNYGQFQNFHTLCKMPI